MFSTLPDLTPRDSHSLWYSSLRAPAHSPPGHREHHHAGDHGGDRQSRQRGQVLERTALHRLAMDELTATRRKVNVANFGSHWLKPPGVSKTLYQLREEKREHEEHQEAMRREQLAQELADAEAAGMPEDGMMDDVQLDGAQDLDDEIPDADDDLFRAHDDDEEEEEEEEEGEEEEDDLVQVIDEDALREERHNDLMAARMRMTDDAFREALIRGDPDGDGVYGDEGELEEEEAEGHMLDEDDFAQSGMDDGMGDMDADLDDDIPEAEDGGYEHTDSEADLSSSSAGDDEDDDDDDGMGHGMGFAPRATPLMGPPQSPTQGSRSATRHSLELSSILSQDESSFMESSPAQGRRARQI